MALSGHYICLSGFHRDVDSDDGDDEKNGEDDDDVSAGRRGESGTTCSIREMWALGKSLGAVMQPHITRRTTVLVAKQGLTRKRLVAEHHHIPVVAPRWLISHGRLSFGDVRVALLSGYIFCATQMAAHEEKALACVIERNGGKFDRTLTAHTSMLFIPPRWLKNWQQQQQQHRFCGRSSTELHGGGVPSSSLPPLPEKIRFAWVTGIPVVEYPRFLSMAALSSSSGDDGDTIVTGDNASSRSDFDTIVQLCAVPVSAAGGTVPHTQCGVAPPETKEGAEEEEVLAVMTTHGSNSRKRCREIVEGGKHAIEKEEHGHDGDDNCGGEGKVVRRDQVAVEVEGEIPSPEHKEQGQGWHGSPPNEWEGEKNIHSLVQDGDTIGMINMAGVHGEHSEASLLGSGFAGATATTSRVPTNAIYSPPCDVGGDESDVTLMTDILFTHSKPFLQVAFLGCTARELIDCTRMALHCRFLRTPVVTHLTDVVVVGGELLEMLGGPTVGTDATRAQQQRGLTLGQLRHSLTINHGVPFEHIVTVEWLRACYQCMMMTVPSSSPHTCASNSDTSFPFLPSPLPLSDVPSTKNFQLQIPSSTSTFDVPQQEEQRQSSLKLSPSGQRKKVLNGSKWRGSSENVKPHAAPMLPGDNLTIKNRYESECLLAERRFRDFLALLGDVVDSGEERSSLFISCLFCFVENDFSRIELAVARALIKHGKGMWLKKTRDEWIKVLTRSSTTTTTEDGGTKRLPYHEGKEHVDDDLVTHVRRCSVTRKRAYRAQVEAAKIVDDDEASTRWLLHHDERRSHREPPHGLGENTSLQHVFYVLPHGDQRPVDILLRDEDKRDTTSQRHPMRYLHAVTQDYLLCCLAAQRLLHPCSCFLFWQPVPSEAERLARRQSRTKDDKKKPLALSLWLGPRRHEKAPLIGVSVYFLCVTNRQQEDAEAEAAVALRRVLVSSLTAAVSDLGGHGAEVLLKEAVTHVVVVHVASIFASTLTTDDADATPPEYWWWSWCCKAEEKREALLACNSTWPHGLQDQLPQDLVEDVAAGRISLVGIEWLHASVAWGVFLDEVPFSLSVTSMKHNPNHTWQLPRQKQLSVMDVGPSAVSAGMMPSAATPPATPQRQHVSPYGVAPASFDLNRRKGMSSSPQAATGYQFDFTTPTSTPGRPYAKRTSLNGSRNSGARQSCPRSTLRTPRRQHVSVSRVISPALTTVSGTNKTTMAVEVSPTNVRSCSGSDTELPQPRQTMTPPRCSDAMVSNRDACTPVRKTCILGENSQSNNSVSDDVVEGSLTQLSRFSIGERSLATTVEMPQQWDPDLGGGICRSSSSKRPLERTPVPFTLQKNLKLDSRPQRHVVGVGTALRIHIVHDLPLREHLVASCTKLSDFACFSGKGMGSEQGHISQRQLQCQVDVTGVVTRIQLIEHSVRDADMLVTHQLTQRESVLAAIAAGLWVVTPKALQDCEARQCFLPLRDLSIYEWCPELLLPDAPRSSLQLAKQCRNRRQQRQASGRRLFEDRQFVLLSSASSVGISRARSMRTVLETGGGTVAWATCSIGDDNAAEASTIGRTAERKMKAPPVISGSVRSATDPTLLWSPAEMLEFVALQIRGCQSDAVDGAWNLSDGACQCSSLAEKELVVLVDGIAEGMETKELLEGMVLEMFRQARDVLGEARRFAVEKKQRRLQHQEARQSYCDGMKGVRTKPSFTAVGHSNDSSQCPILQSATGAPLADSEGRGSSLIIGATRNNTNKHADGMPFVEVVRVFTSDWVTLTIQQRRKVPLCVVDIPS